MVVRRNYTIGNQLKKIQDQQSNWKTKNVAIEDREMSEQFNKDQINPK